MDVRTLALIVVSLLTVVACDKQESADKPSPAAEQPPVKNRAPAELAPSFVNKVWQVAEAGQLVRGSLRVFLSDGTLVMSDANATPAFGSWRFEGGRLTIVEEGQEYRTDILSLSESAFRIRMHSPGEPVEILFEPAEQLPMDATAVEKLATVSAQAEIEPAPSALWGTAWRLKSIAGANVLDRAQATLEFPTEGRASGNGSCNRFNGVVTVEGSTIQFGGLAATRMACAEASAMRQEEAYFAALDDAERFEIDGDSLRIFLAGRTEPLVFSATQATASLPAQSIERVTSTETSPLIGIWTVVGHHLPGVSALSDDAARARYGETVRLTANTATSPGQRCDKPRYATRRVPIDSYLASEFKLPPGSVKPLVAHEQITVLEVACSGALWTALGARLLEIDSNRTLAPWDGVFYELRRDRDFRALGQEPGWQLEIRMGAEMRLTYDYGKGTAVTPASRAQVDSSTGTRTYHSTTEANDLRVVIVPVPCTDSMSGRPFPATVSVTLNNRVFRGCGEELATPYQG